MLLTTQYLDEADQLADRIAVIDHGRVVAQARAGELKDSAVARHPRSDCSTRPSGSSAPRPARRPPDRRPGRARPAVISARVPARARRGTPANWPRRRSAGLSRAGDRSERLRPRPADPRRGLSRAHRQPASPGPRRKVHATGIGWTGAVPCRDLSGTSAGPPQARGSVTRVRLAIAAQDQARARTARRRHRNPRAVHAAVHLPVRRRARRLDPRLPAVPAARHAGPGGRLRHRLQRRNPQPRPRHRGVRPVPVDAGLAAGADRRRADRRPRPLPAGRGPRDRTRLRDGLPAHGGALG